ITCSPGSRTLASGVVLSSVEAVPANGSARAGTCSIPITPGSCLLEVVAPCRLGVEQTAFDELNRAREIEHGAPSVLVVLLLGLRDRRDCTATDINSEGLEHSHGGASLRCGPEILSRTWYGPPRSRRKKNRVSASPKRRTC